ncbi:SKI family transcriptional corepressor 2 [Pseudolycoriella hygida]|uniref:SKI family transcriptional corepressor 2 n=1 Tax=Pseudolycoriella hygida TaxID=35572 RepID=A0A9Q0S2X6_9DIPT|nr:SKI family transcriptional corepressor 2 [Pseudolycoriella hygida]
MEGKSPISPHLMKRAVDSKIPQPDCTTSSSMSPTLNNPKPNQVSTVLLYGIPIVSLFIEAQERLCLAQISNTLLKQFSYNEIHNRRVALGITCVQCTPVQLEILRRAGAMPVSSRRCGMITRREAERLCKSFLGDNAPPRLPDDFAFSVHHECAWGCRGSFLPARYNSSRAKCIKCSYCGLFFSPNKFIFHSHRVGPGDKYVQPDAANFNSWRRHMKLSGAPPEEITHAWEDVKAMFNGGTRKRLMNSSPSTPHSHSHGSSHHRMPSPKRLKESPISPPIIQAAAVVAATTQFPIRPAVNIHPNSNSATSPSAGDIPLPFSRSFMMDYMWHAQNKHNTFQFPSYAIPWLKRPGSLLFNQQSNNSTNGESGLCVRNTIETKSMPFYSNSAFKPVVNNNTQCNTSGNLSSNGVDEVNRVSNEPSIVQTNPVSNSSTDDDHRSSCELTGDGDFQRDVVSSDDEMVDIETTEETEYKNGVMVKEDEIKCDKDEDGDNIEEVNECGKGKALESCGSEGFVNLPEEWHGVTFKKEDHNGIVECRTPTPTKPPSNTIHQHYRTTSLNIPNQIVSNTLNSSNNPTITGSTAEFWSVARLSLDRTNDVLSRVPFYRHDISKHLHVFRHGDVTHTHGVG